MTAPILNNHRDYITLEQMEELAVRKRVLLENIRKGSDAHDIYKWALNGFMSYEIRYELWGQDPCRKSLCDGWYFDKGRPGTMVEFEWYYEPQPTPEDLWVASFYMKHNDLEGLPVTVMYAHALFNGEGVFRCFTNCSLASPQLERFCKRLFTDAPTNFQQFQENKA